MAKMIQASSFVPGRMYSIIYTSDVSMVQKRELDNQTINQLAKHGVVPDSMDKNGKRVFCNPLFDCAVTVRRVSTVQAAGNETWNNYKLKNGIETGEPTREPWWAVSPQNDCIVTHNKTGVEYLRGLPKGISKEEYFIWGKHATQAEVETIRAFKKSSSDAEFVFLTIDKLDNVTSLES